MTKVEFDEPSKVELSFDSKVLLEIRAAAEKSVALMGYSKNWMAVYGESETFQGLHGESKSGIGVVGNAHGITGTGVWGLFHAEKGQGVLGQNTSSGAGVIGESEEGIGVFGKCNKGVTYGVQGFSIPDGVGAILAVGGKHALVARNGTQSAGRFEGNVEVTGHIKSLGNIEVTGDIKLLNADFAEEFDILEENVESGTVMVLTENGYLHPSNQEYDKKVTGIVSGAGGYKPAIILGSQHLQSQTQKESQNEMKETKNRNRLPIALMGKVYCKVDARRSSIEIGDLLTTSSTKGHAMKAQDPLKAFGAVIGKALGSIKEGLGTIPILVTLQ